MNKSKKKEADKIEAPKSEILGVEYVEVKSKKLNGKPTYNQVVLMEDKDGNKYPITIAGHLTSNELYAEILAEKRTYPFDQLNEAELQEVAAIMQRQGFKKCRINAQGKIFIESPFFFNMVVNAYQIRKIEALYLNGEPVLEEIKEKFVPSAIITPKNPSFARHKNAKARAAKAATANLGKSGIQIAKRVALPKNPAIIKK